jgi:phage I-like protein
VRSGFPFSGLKAISRDQKIFVAKRPDAQAQFARMPTAPQADFAIHALAAALPSGETPPEWITIFPKVGRIDTRDGRSYDVDAAALMARFKADGVAVPIDVNHATHHAARTGARADAVGWINELRVEGGALQGKVEWLAEGKSLLAAKSYRFLSPDFFHTPEGVTTWLRSVALVTAPALGGQKALAAAFSKESNMDKLAAALGVTAGANEVALLAALDAGFVPKKNHDELVAQLAASQAKLTEIETAGRKARVDTLIEGALKEKKILPAEKDHYAQLCATDSGFESVKALLAAKSPALGKSGLDEKREPEGGAMPTPALLAAEAQKLVDDGKAPDIFEAVATLEKKYSAAA